MKAEHSQEIEWSVFGKKLRVRSSQPELLREVMQDLDQRIFEIQKDRAQSSPLDLCLLLLLEMAMEREDLRSAGKALLKRTDQLVESVSEMTRSS